MEQELKKKLREEAYAENLKLIQTFERYNSKFSQNLNSKLKRECSKLYKSV
jgi:hypothetical protein